jgi:hypothetical protein
VTDNLRPTVWQGEAGEAGGPAVRLLHLYRLGQTEHAEKLLLKGALLLRVWKILMARPTMDIDVFG